MGSKITSPSEKIATVKPNKPDLNYIHDWNCLQDQSVEQRRNEAYELPIATLWCYTFPIWNNIDYPTEEEIRSYLNVLKARSERNELIMNTHCCTGFQSEIYDIIIDFLPFHSDIDETDAFLDQYPGSEIADAFVANRYISSYERVMDFGIALINRFLVGVDLVSGDNKREYIDMNKGIKGVLSDWVDTIYWFRNGTKRYWIQKRVKEKIIYPFKPAEVLGKLKNGKYFFYKDGNPNYYGRAGRTHYKWKYLIADNMKALFQQMDKKEIELFMRQEKEWHPL